MDGSVHVGTWHTGEDSTVLVVACFEAKSVMTCHFGLPNTATLSQKVHRDWRNEYLLHAQCDLLHPYMKLSGQGC